MYLSIGFYRYYVVSFRYYVLHCFSIMYMFFRYYVYDITILYRGHTTITNTGFVYRINSITHSGKGVKGVSREGGSRLHAHTNDPAHLAVAQPRRSKYAELGKCLI